MYLIFKDFWPTHLNFGYNLTNITHHWMTPTILFWEFLKYLSKKAILKYKKIGNAFGKILKLCTQVVKENTVKWKLKGSASISSMENNCFFKFWNLVIRWEIKFWDWNYYLL